MSAYFKFYITESEWEDDGKKLLSEFLQGAYSAFDRHNMDNDWHGPSNREDMAPMATMEYEKYRDFMGKRPATNKILCKILMSGKEDLDKFKVKETEGIKDFTKWVAVEDIHKVMISGLEGSK